MLDRKTEEEYVEKLSQELHQLVRQYQERYEHFQQHTLSSGDTFQIISGCMGIGATVGSSVPGLGNVIGVAGGAVVGLVTVRGVQFKYNREARQYHNAEAVISFLGIGSKDEDRDAIIVDAAKKVIAARAPFLAQLRDPAAAIHVITQFLAVNMLAAAKEHHFKRQRSSSQLRALLSKELCASDKAQVMVDGVQRQLSHKHTYHLLHCKDGFYGISILAKPTEHISTTHSFSPATLSAHVEAPSQTDRLGTSVTPISSYSSLFQSTTLSSSSQSKSSVDRASPSNIQVG